MQNVINYYVHVTPRNMRIFFQISLQLVVRVLYTVQFYFVRDLAIDKISGRGLLPWKRAHGIVVFFVYIDFLGRK